MHRVLSEIRMSDAAAFVEKPVERSAEGCVETMVAAGAPYAGHWAFAQPQRAAQGEQADWAAHRSTVLFGTAGTGRVQPAAEANASGCYAGCRWISPACRRLRRRWRRFSGSIPERLRRAVDRLRLRRGMGAWPCRGWITRATPQRHQTDGSRQQWPCAIGDSGAERNKPDRSPLK